MLASEFESMIREILVRDPRYHKDSYFFLRDALEVAQSLSCEGSEDLTRHVDAMELLEGIKKHAMDIYGPMTKFVLNEWGIHKCQDFGNMVFNLIDIGLFRKNEDDHPDDFNGGYDFSEAFEKPYLPEVSKNRFRQGGTKESVK